MPLERVFKPHCRITEAVNAGFALRIEVSFNILNGIKVVPRVFNVLYMKDVF